jgi:ELWxxDGT repeat protein
MNKRGICLVTSAIAAVSTCLLTADAEAAWTATATLVKDAVPGPSDSGYDRLSVHHGSIYFRGRSSGAWVSDGTAGGTVELTDDRTSLLRSVDVPVVFQGNTYYVSKDAGGEVAVWKTDGTAGGTVKGPVVDAVASPSYRTYATPKGFYIAPDRNQDSRLLRYNWNDTSLRTVYAGVAGWERQPLDVIGEDLYFGASSVATSRSELWRATRTDSAVISDAFFYTPPSDFAGARVGNKLVFSALESAPDNKLWVSNGTSTGTSVLADLELARNFASLGPRALFESTDGIWTTDGTSTGTSLLIPGSATASGSPATGWRSSDGRAFVTTPDGSATDIWFTDGTPNGTHLIINSLQQNYGGVSRAVLLDASHFAFLTETALWITDGTAEGTQRLITEGTGDALVDLAVLDGELYVLADLDQRLYGTSFVNGRELYHIAITPEPATLATGLACLPLLLRRRVRR